MVFLVPPLLESESEEVWLQAYPLNAHTALDYFSLSPFYEHICSNEEAKRQGLHSSQLQ